jgi:hypothetical protein
MINDIQATAFTKALQRNDIATATQILEETNNFESLGAARGELLRYAAENCSLAGVQMLLERGIQLTAAQAGERPLLPGVGDNLVLCRMLVELGVDVNERNAYGGTALHRAVMFDKPDVCAYLLEQGADPNLFDSEHKVPLHQLTFTSLGNALTVVRAFAAAGANTSIVPDLYQEDYMTPFQQLVEDGRHPDAVEFLIECGEDLDQVTVRGKTLEQITIVTRMLETLRAARTAQQLGRAIGSALPPPTEHSSDPLRRRGFEPF